MMSKPIGRRSSTTTHAIAIHRFRLLGSLRIGRVSAEDMSDSCTPDRRRVIEGLPLSLDISTK